MATVNKNFKVKHGLVVEGTTGTINGEDILTKAQADIDYIIDQVGGSGESTNTPNTLVLRDANGDFAAGTITADLTGQVSDISNHDTDDLSEGATNKYYSTTQAKEDAAALLTGATKTNISITGDENGLTITAENGVADSTTDDLDEGATNLYFTNQRALDATATAYDAAGAAAAAQTAAEGYADGLAVNYDAAGSAGDVAADLSTHEGLTSGVHGVTGDVVGTTDTQDISNKRIVDTLYFTDGVTISDEGEIAVRAVSHDFDVQANQGDLHLKTVAADSDVQITSTYGDILLNAAGTAYYGSASAGNEIATHGYVDSAISGLTWKQSVNLLYDAAIPVLSGSGATQLIVDGHDVLGDADSGYRLLLTGATSPGIYVYNSTSGSWTLTRSEDADAFGELIGAAVYVMEGTQYGSTSWVQGNHYLTDFTGQTWTQFSGQGSVTAGDGITVDGLEVSIDRTTVDDWYEAAGAVSTHSGLTTGVHGVTGDVVGTSDSQTLTNKTIDASSNTLSNIANSSLTNSSITVNGYSTDLGSTVTLDTDDVSEGTTNQYFTQTRARDSFSEGTGINIATGEISVDIGSFDSDDISEGAGNLYFTDGRAADAAAALLTAASLTNITITGTGAGLTITAENGVADSTTTDLAEGTNLYFTDTRAKDAVSSALGDGIEYEAGAFNVQVGEGLEIGGGTGNEIVINRTTVDTWYDANGAAATAQGNAEDYADGLAGNYEVAGAAAAAQTAAEGYADGLAVNYDAAGSAAAAESDANSYTDSLIGDVTVDGTSGNTVTARIATAVSNLVDSAPATLDTLNELAEALQDNPDIISDLQDIAAGKQDTLTAGANIDITGATISVTGLDTDDVSEGTNLYFTDARAVDALEAVVPNFTEVDLNSVATQVAATGSATAATATTAYSFAKADYRSAKFLVKVAYGTHTEISEVLLTLDTSDNVAITEYAIVGTNGTLSAVSAAVSGANVNLLVTPTNTSTVTVMGTLLA
jgi:hypothetical protein